jgi:protein-S-isoprenylcysteine O-methyltransferase Ste14
MDQPAGAAPHTLIRRPGLAACFAAIRHPALYRNFAIHLFVMFPAAMVMCFLGTKVDAALHVTPRPPMPLAAILGPSLIGIGGVWVWYVYGYLFLSGGGSPGTHVDGGPTTMVDTGPYTVIRHPSVLGKMLGVIGLGIAWQSPSFLLGFVPILVVYSVVTNRWLQERFCDARFGSRYARYRERVPMLVPRPAGLLRWWRDEAAVPEDLPIGSGELPAGIWLEFRGYLVGLGLLIGLFVLAWQIAMRLGG